MTTFDKSSIRAFRFVRCSFDAESGVARLVYGASDPKTGACGSVTDLVADPRHNHHVHVQGGVLGEEAGRRLTNYFRAKRGKPPLQSGP